MYFGQDFKDVDFFFVIFENTCYNEENDERMFGKRGVGCRKEYILLLI